MKGPSRCSSHYVAAVFVIIGFSECVSSDDIPNPPQISKETTLFCAQDKVIDESEIDLDLLARFNVPKMSTASKQSPLRIQAKYIDVNDNPPFTVRAFVLLPIDRKDSGAKNERSTDQNSYVKVPFGQMDVIAPVKPGEQFELFPYEYAEQVRKRVSPGKEVLVGIEAWSLANGADKSKQLDVKIKSRRIISW